MLIAGTYYDYATSISSDIYVAGWGPIIGTLTGTLDLYSGTHGAKLLSVNFDQ